MKIFALSTCLSFVSTMLSVGKKKLNAICLFLSSASLSAAPAFAPVIVITLNCIT